MVALRYHKDEGQRPNWTSHFGYLTNGARWIASLDRTSKPNWLLAKEEHGLADLSTADNVKGTKLESAGDDRAWTILERWQKMIAENSIGNIKPVIELKEDFSNQPS